MEDIQRDRSVVLVMDYQISVLRNYTNGDTGLVERAARVLDAARAAKVPVAYVQIAFREGYPEVGPKSSFARMRAAGILLQNQEETAIHPGIAPKPGEVVVTKKRIGAFAGSDLDLYLRSHGLDNLIIMGVATSGVVLSTIRLAADMDYSQIVISDCCSDQDAEVHRVLLEKVLIRQAQIVTADEVIKALAANSATS